MIDLDVMFFQARMRIGRLVDDRADDAKTEIRAMAESARRSIGQKVRHAKERA